MKVKNRKKIIFNTQWELNLEKVIQSLMYQDQVHMRQEKEWRLHLPNLEVDKDLKLEKMLVLSLGLENIVQNLEK